ncbi:MAG: DUF3168 domain-containing protein [Sphingomonadales bacterium]|nr:DUF3168 domain-containing protein [Sphingomonadales bacterium]
MSDPAMAVQAAIVAALNASSSLSAEISGVFDGPPPRARFPYVTISDGLVTDWSTKTEPGREVRVALTVWDDGDSPARLHRLMDETAQALTTLPAALDGWRLVSCIFLRSLVARSATGPWAGLVEHRVRMMAD